MRVLGIAAVVVAAIAAIGYAFLFDRDSESAVEFYERYRSTVIEGRSFAEDAVFYSARKRAQVEADIAARGDDAEEFKEFYLEFTARAEACGTRVLISEEIREARARLVYDIVDCPEYAETESAQDIIDLVDEGGWKIDSNETSVRN